MKEMLEEKEIIGQGWHPQRAIAAEEGSSQLPVTINLVVLWVVKSQGQKMKSAQSDTFKKTYKSMVGRTMPFSPLKISAYL